jgi:hypothetical protein
MPDIGWMHMLRWFTSDLLPENRAPVFEQVRVKVPWDRVRPTFTFGHRKTSQALGKQAVAQTLEEKLDIGQALEEQAVAVMLASVHFAYRTIPKHRRPTVVWEARDAEAVAWIELFHAASNGATAKACALCGTLFLRPRTYPASLCPTCREPSKNRVPPGPGLNWRQQKRMRSLPKMLRSYVAQVVYLANLEDRQITEDDWRDFAEKANIIAAGVRRRGQLK